MTDFGKWLTADESGVCQLSSFTHHSRSRAKTHSNGCNLSLTLCHRMKIINSQTVCSCVWWQEGLQLEQTKSQCSKRQRRAALHPIVIESFIRQGHHLVMGSTCMGDVMALIGRHVWQIGMVGTCQSNRASAGEMAKCDLTRGTMERGSCKLLLHQHEEVWGDNNFVKTLSNFHTPVVTEDGLRKK